MSKPVSLGGVFGTVVIVFALGAALVGAEGDPPVGLPVPFKPVLDVEQLMENQEKAFKGLKSAVLDQKWKDAKLDAWLLAELANVNRQHAPQATYSEYAGKMSDACMSLAADLNKKDPKLATAGISRIGNVCNSCHNEYQKNKRE